MESTGIIRRMDDLGRIVIPIELRRVLGISDRDHMDIYVRDDAIILRRLEPSCVFCTSREDLIDYKEKMICGACLKELRGD